MRLFVAIELSDAMKDALADAQADLYDRGARGNFTREENLHLTLAFIGEYGDPAQAADALASVRFAPFTLALDGCGSFGDLWWAGLRGSSELDALVRGIRRALAESGIPFDRKRFSPHVTLLRRARGARPVRVTPCAMTVSRFVLMRSDRVKSGMRYTAIAGFEAEE
ncbi:MAG: RNA 2',3'-cyclic phosphodiesterase [Clostridia bacterium]|nr:RNA 2',3'-cyclic phosphodiesterase [Clostridia bacterium]